jgi:hypothetical protein
MSYDINPFAHELKNPRIRRVFELQTEEGVIRRQHDGYIDRDFISDEPLFNARIFFDDRVAKASRDGSPPDVKFGWKYFGIGKLIKITYLVVGEIDSELVELGEFENRKEAESVQRGCRQLCRRTGFEINLSHLPPGACDYLNRTDRFSGLYVPRVSIEVSNAIGFRLLFTPWTDEYLRFFINHDLAYLKLQFLNDGMPPEFAELLIQAGQANVRYLVFDKDAPVLEGLPVYGN